MIPCKACGLPAHPMTTCGVARRLAEKANSVADKPDPVSNTVSNSKQHVSNRHRPGYKKEYMREYMRKRRAAAP